MARCGWCDATDLSETVDGLEVHKPSFKKNLPSTADCSGYVTYLEREEAAQPKTKN